MATMIKDPVIYDLTVSSKWKYICAKYEDDGVELLFSCNNNAAHLTFHQKNKQYDVLFLIDKRGKQYQIDRLSVQKEEWLRLMFDRYQEYAMWFLYHPEWL